jgi:hypothetical protein
MLRWSELGLHDPSDCRLSSRDLSQEDGGDGGGTGHHDGTADSAGSTSVLGGAGTVDC